MLLTSPYVLYYPWLCPFPLTASPPFENASLFRIPGLFLFVTSIPLLLPLLPMTQSPGVEPALVSEGK